MGRYPGKQFDNKRPGRSDDRPTMHDAVCDDCGNDCKVPFKPSSDKPIFCSRCFEKQDNKHSDRGGRNEYRNSGGSRGSDMFSAVCDDCGNDCKVPFKPSGDKPIYCSSCFEDRGNTHDKQRVTRERGGNRNENNNSNVSNEQLEKINQTLEKILKVLETKPEPKPKKKPVKKVVKTEDEEKPKKVAKKTTKKATKKETKPKKKATKTKDTE